MQQGCFLHVSSVRNHPLINLSSIKDLSFDNILKSRIQMTNRRGGLILTSSLKIPEMTSSKTRQTISQGQEVSKQRVDWDWDGVADSCLCINNQQSGAPTLCQYRCHTGLVMSSSGVKREVGECFLLSCYLDHGIESWPWSLRHLGPPPFTPG